MYMNKYVMLHLLWETVYLSGGRLKNAEGIKYTNIMVSGSASNMHGSGKRNNGQHACW